MKRLLIASPAKGGVPLMYVAAKEELMRHPLPGWDTYWAVEANNSALNISRDILANAAIGHNFDRVIFQDTDHPLRREHYERILSHDHVDVPIVSGLYAVKRSGKPFLLGIRQKGAQMRPDCLLAADFLPTGFLSVSVDALKTMVAFHKDREVYVQDHTLLPPGPRRANTTMGDLFPIGPQGPRTPQARLKKIRKAMEIVLARGVSRMTKPEMLAALQGVQDVLTAEGEPGYLMGEDYSFSWLARQAGIACFLDLKCLVPHRGEIDFPITDPAVLCTEFDSIPEAEGNQDLW